MKTLKLRLLRYGVGVCIGVLLFSTNIQAQHNPGYHLKDSVLIMELKDIGYAEMPQKLIFVFEESKLTLDFSEPGEIAMVSTNFSNTMEEVLTVNIKSEIHSGISDWSLDDNIRSIINEPDDAEEELDFKSWMVTPLEWLK